MTTTHPEAVWQAVASPAGQLTGKSRAAFIGRQFPAYNLDTTPFGPPVSIIPYAIPWLNAADSWGVAFPAGTVGVVNRQRLTLPLATDYLASLEAYWSDLTLGQTYAVPGVLPSGYTAQTQIAGFGEIGLGALFTASGYTIQGTAGSGWPNWIPNAQTINGYSDSFDTSIASSPSVGLYFWPQLGGANRPGWRKLQYSIGYVAASAAPGNIVLTISHNLDGTLPATNTNGNVIDWTHSHPASDFVFSGGSVNTAWIDAGAVLCSTNGVVANFVAKLDTTGAPLAGAAAGVAVSFRLSPRCDIPFFTTVVGYGGLIAPGGTPPP
jgi:hypothetical protein